MIDLLWMLAGMVVTIGIAGLGVWWIGPRVWRLVDRGRPALAFGAVLVGIAGGVVLGLWIIEVAW